ncbi:hypothetical protein C7M84_009907 [Penaeus vannamei]|uniref:Uncharacterized protein n=1 Tax=Penaeus vannamei TaxID=6689 RepID=A0A3R7PHC7_PENVA|nr:hypothetical protein C7M84_009907 [Penaeus vannamei]
MCGGQRVFSLVPCGQIISRDGPSRTRVNMASIVLCFTGSTQAFPAAYRRVTQRIPLFVSAAMRMRYFWMLGFVTTAAALLLEAEEAQGKGVEEEVDLGPCEEAKGSCVPERNCSRIISGAECPEGNVCCTEERITDTIETRAVCGSRHRVLSGLSKWQLQVLRSAVQDDELVVPEGRLLRDQRGLLRGHPHAGVPGLGVHVPREGMPECKPKKQCKWKGRYCTTGKCKNNERVIKRACQGKKCRCCAPGRVCKRKTKCKENKGSCRQGRCKSYEKEIYEGCKGLRCRCCALDMEAYIYVRVGVDTSVPCRLPKGDTTDSSFRQRRHEDALLLDAGLRHDGRRAPAGGGGSSGKGRRGGGGPRTMRGGQRKLCPREKLLKDHLWR